MGLKVSHLGRTTAQLLPVLKKLSETCDVHVAGVFFLMLI